MQVNVDLPFPYRYLTPPVSKRTLEINGKLVAHRFTRRIEALPVT